MRLKLATLIVWILLGVGSGCSKASEPDARPGASSTGALSNGTNQSDLESSTQSANMTDSDATGTPKPARPPNILLFIADDLGVDVLASSGFTKNPALTPNLDKLAAQGLVFENFWVTPACTTTRGALISGKHGFATGIDHVPAVMPKDTLTVQHRLKLGDLATPYATGLFGKWHLGGAKPAAEHPNQFGIDNYAGNLFNLDNYSDWTLTQNGQQSQSVKYHTSAVVDLAQAFISAQPAEQPWFAWVAFAAPHPPFHAPPASLVSAAPNDTSPSQYKAMVESMDTEIGRLLDGLSEQTKSDTLIIFIGDNGTPVVARDREIFAKDHVKGSIYEGGIRAPMIVAGAGVSRKGSKESALVNATDFFGTVVQLASPFASPDSIPGHSVSFAHLLSNEGAGRRRFNYAEWKSEGELFWAVRDVEYKVIRFPDGTSKLFATSDLSETQPLDDAAISERLLKFGEDFRQGKIEPGVGAGGETYCSKFSGTTTHQALDVGRNMSLSGTVTVTAVNDACVIKTNGIPDHRFNDGSRSFPHDVAEQDFDLQVPLNPKLAAATTPLSLDTDNGVLSNGAKVDMLAAACFGVGDEKVGCNDMNQPWRFDPVFQANGFRVDSALAHTQPTGAYHYHGVGTMAQNKGVLGVAADGFMIHSAQIDVLGNARTMRSSYRLRQGNRVNTDASKPNPGGSYDGTFRDDWEYVPGHGDLDECNGATVNGQYMYFATQAFPYFMGCFRGTPDPSFRKRGPWQLYQHAHEHGVLGVSPGEHEHSVGGNRHHHGPR